MDMAQLVSFICLASPSADHPLVERSEHSACLLVGERLPRCGSIASPSLQRSRRIAPFGEGSRHPPASKAVLRRTSISPSPSARQAARRHMTEGPAILGHPEPLLDSNN